MCKGSTQKLRYLELRAINPTAPPLSCPLRDDEHALLKLSKLWLALLFSWWTHAPSIAQLVERWTVVEMSDIHRSLVQIRLEGLFYPHSDQLPVNPLILNVLVTRVEFILFPRRLVGLGV